MRTKADEDQLEVYRSEMRDLLPSMELGLKFAAEVLETFFACEPIELAGERGVDFSTSIFPKVEEWLGRPMDDNEKGAIKSDFLEAIIFDEGIGICHAWSLGHLLTHMKRPSHTQH